MCSSINGSARILRYVLFLTTIDLEVECFGLLTSCLNIFSLDDSLLDFSLFDVSLFDVSLLGVSLLGVSLFEIPLSTSVTFFG